MAAPEPEPHRSRFQHRFWLPVHSLVRYVKVKGLIESTIGFQAVDRAVSLSLVQWVGEAVQEHFENIETTACAGRSQMSSNNKDINGRANESHMGQSTQDKSGK